MGWGVVVCVWEERCIVLVLGQAALCFDNTPQSVMLAFLFLALAIGQGACLVQGQPEFDHQHPDVPRVSGEDP